VATPARSVEANARLTGLVGLLLLVLLGAEVTTILALRRLLLVHFFLGFLLLPPVLLKLGSTGYRFFRYYTGDPAYRRAGTPPTLLRLTAPVVVVSTVVVFASGIELWLFGLRYGLAWLSAHEYGFVVWFCATTVHVVGHLERTPRLALQDFRPGSAVPGALTRRSLLGASLLMGLVLALATAGLTPFGPAGGG
jgi:hypothetical protein